MIVCYVDIGGIVDHHCLEVIVHYVDIGGIIDHHCLEVIVRYVDIGGIVDHHCLEVIVRYVDIGGIVDHHCLIFLFISIGSYICTCKSNFSGLKLFFKISFVSLYYLML